MEMLVGVGAARVRDLFGTAKKSAPSIIFIDEIDAIGRMRGYGIAGGHDEREQTLNQILVEMDGFTPNDNVVIVAATNRGDLLDPALLRPGRFDRRVTLDMPDLDDRKAILGIHSRGKPMTSTIDWERIAKRTVGFSGADLENMLNEAAILAARNNRKEVTAADVEEAALKVKLGPEKKRLQTDHDRKMTAYHEAGHALVSYYLPNMDPVHRISIVSRGITLGQTVIPPSRDRIHETKSHLVEQVASMMGGRAAEDLVFKEFTTGASSDIDQATRVARSMVMEFGMSDLGPINLGPQMELTEWGRMWNEQPQVSQQMQNRIDQEVKKIVDTAYQKAVTIIKKFRKKLDLVAEELLKKETLESEDFERIMGGAKVLSNPELAFIKAKK
ncbi:MAG: ATP-dependent zinc metalloprotease FtsH [Microgenomates group bacterium GW2011_GWA1_Microgenomates_45_10]|nr:MAG: ATP-dependent zinc metalloprotease FtsH [Microgenomates group bacterium GW2011_GWA1_Microgenomates_45_10]